MLYKRFPHHFRDSRRKIAVEEKVRERNTAGLIKLR